MALSADRDRLAAGIHVPWPLLAGFGAVAAGWVGAAAGTTPGEGYQPPGVGLLGVALVLVIVYSIQRKTGVRFAKMGWQAELALVSIAVGCLVLFSISLGLVSLGLHWAVILTAAAAFVLTTWLAGVAYHSALRTIRHG